MVLLHPRLHLSRPVVVTAIFGDLGPRTLQLDQYLLARRGEIEVRRKGRVPFRDDLHRHMTANLQQVESRMPVRVSFHLEIAVTYVILDGSEDDRGIRERLFVRRPFNHNDDLRRRWRGFIPPAVLFLLSGRGREEHQERKDGRKRASGGKAAHSGILP